MGLDPADSLSGALPSTSSAIVADRPKKNVVVLKTRVDGPFASEQTIYLCGTSHVSKKSWEDVREIIQAVKPQVVMLELCDERMGALFSNVKVEDGATLWQHLQIYFDGKKSLLSVMYAWMLATIAQKCGVDPGEEFRIAVQEANKVGSQISTGDRLVSITLDRTWAALTSWQKVKLIFDILMGGLYGSKEDADLLDSLTEDEDALTAALKEVATKYPGMWKPLIDERDEHMVWSLRILASQASKIVAVVGAGHLKGIQDKWDSDIDIEEITRRPEQKHRSGPSWTHVVLVGAASATVIASVAFAVRWRKLD